MKRLLIIFLSVLLFCSCANETDTAVISTTATSETVMPQTSALIEPLNITPLESLEYYTLGDNVFFLPYENWAPLEDNVIIRKYFYGIWEGFEWWDNGRNQNDNGYLIIDDSEKTNIQRSFNFDGYFIASENVIAAIGSGGAGEYYLYWLNTENHGVMYCTETGKMEYEDYGWGFLVSAANCSRLTKTDLPLNEPQDGFMSRVRLEEMAKKYGIDKDLLITTKHFGYVVTVDRLNPFYLVSEESERIVIRAELFTMAGKPPILINTIEKINGEWVRTIEEKQVDPEMLNALHDNLSEEYIVDSALSSRLGITFGNLKEQIGNVKPQFYYHAEYYVNVNTDVVSYAFQGDVAGSDWVTNDTHICEKIAAPLGRLVLAVNEPITVAELADKLNAEHEIRQSGGSSYFLTGEDFAVLKFPNSSIRLEIAFDVTDNMAKPDSKCWLRLT